MNAPRSARTLPLRPATLRLLGAATLLAAGAAHAGDDLGQHYGFLPLEVVKIDPKAGPFVAADMNGDGLQDLVVVDNFKNRIDIHYQKKGAKPTDEVKAPRDVNEFPDHWRFRRESVTVDREVEAVIPFDYDGDGMMDLVYAGNSPAGIVFVRQTEPGVFKIQRKQSVRNLGSARDSFLIADLMGGPAKELLSIVDGKITIWPLDKDSMGAPTELSAGGSRVVAVLVDDFDGNGSPDIVGIVPEDPAPLRAWFTERQGDRLVIGPQVRFEMPPVREVAPVRLPSEKSALLGVVERPTKRVVFHRAGRGKIEGAGTRDSSLITWSFEDPANRKRRTVFADVNADGLTDVVATNTLANALMTYRQESGKGLGAPLANPSFADLDSVVVAPTKEGSIVFTLSEKEGVVGRSTAGKDGSIGFPQAVQLGAGRTPVSINLVDLNGERHLAVVAKDGKNFVVELVPVDWQDDASKRVVVNLGAQSRSPNAVVALDADQDGFTDLLVFTPEKPMIMLQAQPKVAVEGKPEGKEPAKDAKEGKESKETKDAKETKSDAKPDWVPFKVLESKDMGQFGLVQAANGDNTLVADADGNGKSELLVADRNYVRALRFEPKPAGGASPGWQVVTQMNAKNTDAKLVALTQLGDRIVAGDRDGARAIVFARGKEGKWEQSEIIEIPGFKFSQLAAGKFAGDGKDGLVAVGDDAFALVRLAGERILLETVGSWTSDDPRQVPHELVPGDLNGDGFTDVVVLDGGEQMADILTFSQAQRLLHALSFKIFETRLFSGGERQEFEPSMGEIVDVTGDGLNDLVLLAHDRLLIYPQARGGEPTAAASAAAPAAPPAKGGKS
ncbi:MAG: VCBS repeat-containing protein [Phycisphaerales bacterium]